MNTLGYIILTYRPLHAMWQPFSRTTVPLMHTTHSSATAELEQVRLNYPGHRFILSTVQVAQIDADMELA